MSVFVSESMRWILIAMMIIIQPSTNHAAEAGDAAHSPTVDDEGTFNGVPMYLDLLRKNVAQDHRGAFPYLDLVDQQLKVQTLRVNQSSTTQGAADGDVPIGERGAFGLVPVDALHVVLSYLNPNESARTFRRISSKCNHVYQHKMRLFQEELGKIPERF